MLTKIDTINFWRVFFGPFLALCWIFGNLVSTCWLKFSNFFGIVNFAIWALKCRVACLHTMFICEIRVKSNFVISSQKIEFSKNWDFWQKPKFYPSRPLWSTRVDHMLMLSLNKFWGLISIHLKSFHPKYYDMKPKTHQGGSEKPFFRVWGHLLE